MVSVSIIIPAYIDSSEKYAFLTDAIGSVKQQTFQDWEIILIDDCSAFPLNIDTDDKIRYIKMGEQSGPAICRNTAVALARGAAILPLDADDLLPNTETLENMYSEWVMNPDKIIYGDLQRLEIQNGNYEATKKFGLPAYTFERTMELRGIMPVTAMHSVECHVAAGGWKNIFDAGLEDVEYWISAGKAGFCGIKIDEITLLYRKHDHSRAHALRRINRREFEMRNLIKKMHEDIYGGKFPMGCCGGNRAWTPPEQLQGQSAPAATVFEDFPAAELVWVEYIGKRSGKFGIMGQFTRHSYSILGYKHKLQVHKMDLNKFKQTGRGAHFNIDVSGPMEHIEKGPEIIAEYEPPVPEVGVIERLDDIAVQNGTQQINVGEEVVPSEEVQMSETAFLDYDSFDPYDLSKVGLGRFQEIFEMNSWTVERLAKSDKKELMKIKGIGLTTAGQIIKSAQNLIV